MKLFVQLAQTLNAKDLGIPTTSANDILINGLKVAYSVIGIAAVIVIIIAGFILVTSGSEPSAVVKAKNTILYAVVGLIIVIAAAGITQFFIGRF